MQVPLSVTTFYENVSIFHHKAKRYQIFPNYKCEPLTDSVEFNNNIKL